MITLFSAIFSILILTLAFLLIPSNLSRKGKLVVLSLGSLVGVGGLLGISFFSLWKVLFLEVCLAGLFALFIYKRSDIFWDEDHFEGMEAADGSYIQPLFNKRELEEKAREFETQDDYYVNVIASAESIISDEKNIELLISEDEVLLVSEEELVEYQSHQEAHHSILSADTKEADEAVGEANVDEAEELIRRRLKAFNGTSSIDQTPRVTQRDFERNLDSLIEDFEQSLEEDDSKRINTDTDDLEELYLKTRAEKTGQRG